jgi:hypothetical protein
MPDSESKEISIKITDEVLRGVYANQMVVTHTREEFMLDFLTIFPPQGIVAARVLVSPAHVKRIIRALQENIGKYEASNGIVEEGNEPAGNLPLGFH